MGLAVHSPVVDNSMTLRPADLGTIDYAFIGRSQFSADPWVEGGGAGVVDRSGTTGQFRSWQRMEKTGLVRTMLMAWTSMVKASSMRSPSAMALKSIRD